MRVAAAVWFALALVALSLPASAQFDQYSRPGRFEDGREPIDVVIDRGIQGST